MSKIGLFFSSSTGNTRRIAKAIKKQCDDALMAEAVNVNKATPTLFLSYDYLILGSSTLGAGQLPGLSTDCMGGGWEEFLPKLAGFDFTGKTIALFGLGNQDKYPEEFVDAIGLLYDFFQQRGATLVGQWDEDNYEFIASKAWREGQFLGLVLDEENQKMLSADRLGRWLTQVLASMK